MWGKQTRVYLGATMAVSKHNGYKTARWRPKLYPYSVGYLMWCNKAPRNLVDEAVCIK
jgi:hypothetical protein